MPVVSRIASGAIGLPLSSGSPMITKSGALLGTRQKSDHPTLSNYWDRRKPPSTQASYSQRLQRHARIYSLPAISTTGKFQGSGRRAPGSARAGTVNSMLGSTVNSEEYAAAALQPSGMADSEQLLGPLKSLQEQQRQLDDELGAEHGENEVYQWLNRVKFKQYWPSFVASRCDSFAAVCGLTRMALESQLCIFNSRSGPARGGKRP
jgi:hypothetical protein